MWVAGIDYSTHAVDVVCVDLDGELAPTWRRLELSGPNAFDRTRGVHLKASGFDDIVAVGIEDPRGHNAGALYRVQGAIVSHIPAKTLVHPLVPSQWRKLVGLPGNASKDEVRNHSIGTLHAAWPSDLIPITNIEAWNDWPQDAHDAHCIALATRTLLEKENR